MSIHQTQENSVGPTEFDDTCIHTGRRIVKRYGNGGYGKVEGGSISRLSKKKHLSPKDRIIGDMSALGMSGSQISRLLHGENNTKGREVGVRLIKNDPKVQMHTQDLQNTLVQEAKQRLLEAVPRAAENICNAIDEGDVSASFKVLTSFGAVQSGASQRAGDVTVNLAFGDWLISQRREVTVSDDGGLVDTGLKQRRTLTCDASEVDVSVEGERL